jgi:hypothetical protein
MVATGSPHISRTRPAQPSPAALEIPKMEKIMRNLSHLLLPAMAAVAILSVAPAASFAANNPPRDEGQQGVAVVHQADQKPGATAQCRPEYEIWSSHVKWLNDCSSAGQTAYRIYDSHVTWQ